jgi:hypothetical protein
MKRFILAAVALVTIGSLAYTMALAQDAAKDAAKDSAKTVAATEAAKPTTKPAMPRRSTLRLDKDGRPLSPKSTAERTALCRADCKPNNYKECGTWGCTGMHGLYRDYDKYDPQLKSIKGQQDYKQCVDKCLGPLPAIYVQRAVFGAGITSWFGKSKESCLSCHVKGH